MTHATLNAHHFPDRPLIRSGHGTDHVFIVLSPKLVWSVVYCALRSRTESEAVKAFVHIWGDRE